MAQYNSFEDLPIWKESRIIANAIYYVSSVGAFATDYGLRDQIRRAAVSTMSNIADGLRKHVDGPLQRSWIAAQRRAVAFGCTLGRIVRNGFDRESNKEFIRFLSIAKASLSVPKLRRHVTAYSPIRSQLFLALDRKYVTPEVHPELNDQLKELGAEIAGFMRYLENNKSPSDR